MNHEIKEEYLATLNNLELKEARRLIHFLAGYAMVVGGEENVMEMILKEVSEIKEKGY
ncbi:hypothetical protein JMA_26980 [Jeotgalibacillus malaysiensis]|uniref:Uncharacterized protein n=1 Tax=Jeotgalibacillus malaysiensis TaxID=1508404 RepID=A0A0B5AP19_9BACL|nr:hypothetical protein [Jeotgalibacillus malaysiensis]AJD92015.1 hypothetical protein JMA_26980 [Jeotgalibacillus malaysiensis]